MSNEQDIARIRAGFDAYNRRDREALRRLTTADIEIVPLRAALEGIAYRGPDAVDQFWEATNESWSEVTIEIGRIDEGESGFLVLGSLHAIGRETGAPVEANLAFVVSLRDGLMERMITYTDIVEARRAAGLEGD